MPDPGQLISVIGCLFAILAAPTHFLGDGYTLIANLASESGTFYKWSEKAITVLLQTIQSFLGEKNAYTARLSFQIVSVFSGMISVWFIFSICEIISDNREKRFLIFLATFFTGTLLLFFGYVESYPPLLACFIAYIFLSLRYIIKDSGLALASMVFVIGSLIHVQMLIFLPAHLYLLMCKNKGLKIYQRFRKYLLVAGAAVILAIIVAFVHKYTSDLYFENIFLPLFKGKSTAPDYGIFTLAHLLDIVNLLHLLSPVLLLVLFLSCNKLREITKHKNTAFLALISLSGLLFLIIIDPKLGMARDWDLFSLTAIGPTVALTMLISNKRLAALSKLWGTLLIFSLISACTPFLAVNLSNKSSVAYMEYFINLDKGKSLPALKTLHDFYRSHGDSFRADSLRSKFKEYYPNQTRIRMAITALNRGNLVSAMDIVGSITPDKFSSDYHSLMSNIQLLHGNYSRALELSEKAIQLNRYNHVLYVNHAAALAFLSQYERSLEYLRQAYKLNGNDISVLERICTVNLKIGNTDSVLGYAEKLVQVDSMNAQGNYLLSKMHILRGSLDSGKKYYSLYLERAESDSLFAARRSELSELIRTHEDTLE